MCFDGGYKGYNCKAIKIPVIEINIQVYNRFYSDRDNVCNHVRIVIQIQEIRKGLTIIFQVCLSGLVLQFRVKKDHHGLSSSFVFLLSYS